MVPNLALEQQCWSVGETVVVGIDEVGRGAWAGPLSVGAVVVPKDRRIYKLRDSKMLSETEREALFKRVTTWAVAWSVGHVSPAECDALGMSIAQKLAAERAIRRLGMVPDRILIDGNWDFVGGSKTRLIVGGDATCASIAAASIVAKVSRDQLMRGLAESFPAFEFERNKGYPAPRHRMALAGYGPTSIHRRSWKYMKTLAFQGSI